MEPYRIQYSSNNLLYYLSSIRGANPLQKKKLLEKDLAKRHPVKDQVDQKSCKKVVVQILANPCCASI
ncbi:hypothetical protein COOONC_02646 [Cooperia oncophora]